MKTQMKNKSSTKKYFIISVSLFVVSLVLCGFFLFLINAEKEKVKTLSNDLSIANKEDVVALKRAIRNYEESADAVKNLLVDKEKVFDFISNVEDLGEDSGALITVQNIELFDVLKGDELVRNIGVENPGRTHGKFVMSIKAEGDWEAISSFLLKMESFPKHTNIEAMNLSSIFDSKTGAQSWSANFNVITTTN
jgi:hypothetical protein